MKAGLIVGLFALACAAAVAAPPATTHTAAARVISKSKPGIHQTQPSSLAPSGNRRRRVYGAPIQSAIVGARSKSKGVHSASSAKTTRKTRSAATEKKTTQQADHPDPQSGLVTEKEND